MAERPTGRRRNVSGESQDIHKHGSGLGTGPVGDASGRPQSAKSSSTSSSSGTRASGKMNPIVIVLLLLMMFVGGGGGLGTILGLFGGDTSTAAPSAQPSSDSAISDIAGGLIENALGGNGLSSILGTSLESTLNSLGGANNSTGWSLTKNTGSLDSTVASGVRDRYTAIKGGGRDTVTIMVYMCGADLESKGGMATNDIQEMYGATISDNINLLVYTGGAKKWNNSVISNQTNQIWQVKTGGIICLEKDMGASAMTKPATLTGFIDYCKRNYPADRMELIFWNHGGGSISGYGYDEKFQSAGSMSLAGINEALKNAGIKYDFIGFDTCLMATAENALMLSDYADYLIASEETEPGVGWYYTDWLNAFSKNTSIPTIELGKEICDSFLRECNRSCAGQKTTLSVVDLAELEKTLPAELRDFAQSTSKMLDSKKYDAVSKARTDSREFAQSSRIDQVDLVHLASNMGTSEGKALAQAVLGAVKYNVTSSNMTNAYGLSIYFPYQKLSGVNSAVNAYEAIGMDSDYADVIQKFASVETGGQAISGGQSSPLSSILSNYVSGGTVADSPDMISSVLNGLLGGDLGNVAGLFAGNSDFLGKGLDVEAATEFLSENRVDPKSFVWDEDGYMLLPESEWSLINDLKLNVLYDDGDGYIDLGLDTVYEFDEYGRLSGDYDGYWVGINGLAVPYYHESTVTEGGVTTITGRVPCRINDERAELIIVFENDIGRVAGARYFYVEGETETVPKSLTELSIGDTIVYICDYYQYNGIYSDSYLYGEAFEYDGTLDVTDVAIRTDHAVAAYRFRDIYGQTYWSEVME